MLGLGRSKTYELVATGVLPAVRFGRSVRVPAEGLRQWLKEQSSEERITAQRSVR
jgi:prophage regulatory protein